MRTNALSILKRPGTFFLTPAFGIVWTLYAATFTVANATETIAKEFENANVGGIVFASTFLVNVPLGVWKDIRFASIYGNGGNQNISKTPNPVKLAAPLPIATSKVPRAAAATFLVRDAITIFGSFTMAPWLSDSIPADLVPNHHTRATITQLTVPVLTQLFATPLHLLGLDYHNRQYHVAMLDRLRGTRKLLPSATTIRCIRIIPAFSFGCLTNTELRTIFHRKLQ